VQGNRSQAVFRATSRRNSQAFIDIDSLETLLNRLANGLDQNFYHLRVVESSSNEPRSVTRDSPEFFPELYNIEHKPRSTRAYYLGVWLEFRDSERLQVCVFRQGISEGLSKTRFARGISYSRAWRRLCETFGGKSAPSGRSPISLPQPMRPHVRQRTPGRPADRVSGSMHSLIDGLLGAFPR